MRKTIAIMVAALLLLMATPFIAMADDDEADEESGALGDDSNEADEDSAQSMPGFEIALASLGTLAVARLINRR
jgi:hypothetical protein